MIKAIFDIIYPRRCVLCLSHLRSEQNNKLELCADCQSDLTQIKHACYQCGIPLHNTGENQLCGQCLQKKPYFDQVISLYHYQQPMIWLIQQMKFNNKLLFARLLSQLMLKHLIGFQAKKKFSIPDAIIPVPLHHKRQFQRRFNQAEELSRLVANKFNCRLDTQFIERSLNNAQQSGLNARQRKKNVKGIFKINNKKQYSYKHVTVVDDVMSTGSTVNEVARILKQAGIERVDVWILSRAERH